MKDPIIGQTEDGKWWLQIGKNDQGTWAITVNATQRGGEVSPLVRLESIDKTGYAKNIVRPGTPDPQTRLRVYALAIAALGAQVIAKQDP